MDREYQSITGTLDSHIQHPSKASYTWEQLKPTKTNQKPESNATLGHLILQLGQPPVSSLINLDARRNINREKKPILVVPLVTDQQSVTGTALRKPDPQKTIGRTVKLHNKVQLISIPTKPPPRSNRKPTHTKT